MISLLMIENNKAAIEAWESSIKIHPSADAYTSKLSPSSPSSILARPRGLSPASSHL